MIRAPHVPLIDDNAGLCAFSVLLRENNESHASGSLICCYSCVYMRTYPAVGGTRLRPAACNAQLRLCARRARYRYAVSPLLTPHPSIISLRQGPTARVVCVSARLCADSCAEGVLLALAVPARPTIGESSIFGGRCTFHRAAIRLCHLLADRRVLFLILPLYFARHSFASIRTVSESS